MFISRDVLLFSRREDRHKQAHNGFTQTEDTRPRSMYTHAHTQAFEVTTCDNGTSDVRVKVQLKWRQNQPQRRHYRPRRVTSSVERARRRRRNVSLERQQNCQCSSQLTSCLSLWWPHDVTVADMPSGRWDC